MLNMGKTKILSLFFVALFISYFVSTTFYLHTHIIDGATISHSHIHINSHHDTKSGNHTKQSITLISQISHCEYIDFSGNYVLILPKCQIYQNNFVEAANCVDIYFQNLSLRAPPIV